MGFECAKGGRGGDAGGKRGRGRGGRERVFGHEERRTMDGREGARVRLAGRMSRGGGRGGRVEVIGGLLYHCGMGHGSHNSVSWWDGYD